MTDKILAREVLGDRVASIKKQQGRLVFTNGCFDLLHVGHVRYLQAARAEGDVLLVAINSDRSVAHIKGADRPIVPQGDRAEIVAALACVDYVTLFDEPDPLVTIQMVEPDILVKGADWKADAIVGKGWVEERGGRVVRIPLTEGSSTSGLIEKILRMHCKGS
jgi:D-beta-D-heptose 7-phosphate kinase/D-beta-D-heptose 1-phosphate adenosyltransferase